jgi:hypothetical protein
VTKKKIRLKAGPVETVAELNDSHTAESIWRILPVKGIAQTWGDEIYFVIPADLPQENAREVVEVGELGYWPPGKAFCIFFGPTPVSRGKEIRAASPVNVFGKISGDAMVFKKVKSGTKIVVERSKNG